MSQDRNPAWPKMWRGYIPRPPRPRPARADAFLAAHGLTPLDPHWPGYSGYHRIEFQTCRHVTTWSWSHIRQGFRGSLACPACRRIQRFGEP